ncbi:MAG TPA: hydrolase TatD [Elusimicrobia bacterium]|nr:hydrolase TatD [Elusimicrobiota bacterium]
MLIDTHAHLNDKSFDADRKEVVARAAALGVAKIVEIACAPAEWAPGEAFAAAYPDAVRCAFGVHPEYIKDLPPAYLAELETYLQKSCAAAVGEIGLDYWWEPKRKEEQLELLAGQLPLCAKFSKPAVFHARNGKEPAQNAYGDLLIILKHKWTHSPARKFRGVLHCFSGAWADAKAGMDLGLALGVNGTFTYKNNHDLRDTIKKAGLDNLVLETDCPYLPPQSARGKRNDPAFIPEIAAMVASHLGLSNSQTADKTTTNAFELFGVF